MKERRNEPGLAKLVTWFCSDFQREYY